MTVVYRAWTDDDHLVLLCRTCALTRLRDYDADVDQRVSRPEAMSGDLLKDLGTCGGCGRGLDQGGAS